MNLYFREWQLIKAKIATLLETSNFIYRTFQINSQDPYNIVVQSLGNNAKMIFGNIGQFQVKYADILPELANTELLDFIQKNMYINSDESNKDLKKHQIINLITNLSLLENEITYYLSDTQIYIRKSVEVAFEHLNRLLVADKSVRQMWIEAKNEVQFEKLGGAHLLSHKLWAFKIDASGERSDLVLSERINEDSILYRAVDGLVLTEWKLVTGKREPHELIQAAKRQAERYSVGSLATLELSNYRYLIIVSENHLKIPESQIIEGNIIYRIINIAYNPLPPSRA